MTEKDLDIAIEKCERIMEFDTRTMQNPVSENGWIFNKVYELLKFLRECQFKTGTKDGEVDDTISRQAAIKALIENKEMINTSLDSLTLDYNTRRNEEQRREQINEDIETIKDLPPAQPEYEPVTAEDFAKTMSENTIYSFMAWYADAFELMERCGFVICKKTMCERELK